MGDRLRVVRSGYTVLPNALIRDERLTLEAFGLLARMLSLPNDWDFSIGGLAAMFHCGRYKVRSALDEIEGAGYLLREQSHDDAGKFYNTYVLSDVPCEGEKHRVQKLHTVDTVCGLPHAENCTRPLIKKQTKDKQTPISPQKGAAREPKASADWKPERFDGLWQFYPHDKRGNKQKAIAAWDRLKPDDKLIDLIGKNLKILLATVWAEVGTPHVSTFLNGRRWEDAANADGGGAQCGHAAAPHEEALGWQ